MSDIVERLRAEADEMHWAPSGGEGQHAINWEDKPHRVLYDAVRLIRDAADEIQRLTREQDAFKEGLSDPVIVHINMLRGGIAKLPTHLVEHLYPSIRKERDALKTVAATQGAAITRQGERIGALKAENERLRDALVLAANRLDRLSLETPHGSRLRCEAYECTDAARSALNTDGRT